MLKTNQTTWTVKPAKWCLPRQENKTQVNSLVCQQKKMTFYRCQVSYHYNTCPAFIISRMPYGYDKTRTERRCKDCNKLLYVFETGEFCIESSRKQAKTWSAYLQTRWMEKNYDWTRSTTEKTISYASWSGKRISCLHVRKIPKPATVWWFSCRIRSWTKNSHSYGRWIYCVLRMQAQQGWNRKGWWNPQLTVARYIVKRNYFFFSQSHSGRSSSSSIIIGFKQILIFLSYNKFHYSRYTIELLIFF